MTILDIGMNWGLQTCFLAKEYDVHVIGIDPGNHPFREDKRDNVIHLLRNAKEMGVEDKIIAQKIGVPETHFADNSFKAIYSTTTFEMIRGFGGQEEYMEALSEVWRILKPGGLFGYAEPMHLETSIPPELKPYVEQGSPAWVDFLNTIDETKTSFEETGFDIIEADYAPDSKLYWQEFLDNDPEFLTDPHNEEKKMHQIDQGRWFSFGYLIAKKPAN
jgi:cyclopropane fatty-acyl-phospholipid synthase-like methyltransferase